jgi:hypothetical protein
MSTLSLLFCCRCLMWVCLICVCVCMCVCVYVCVCVCVFGVFVVVIVFSPLLLECRLHMRTTMHFNLFKDVCVCVYVRVFEIPFPSLAGDPFGDCP